MIEAIQQNFANPLGLLTALSIIPLLAFYLFKPEPEEEVMPSMVFFEEKEEKSQLAKAFRRLKTNWLLLFHILIIMVAAVAAADPLMQGLEADQNAVIVIDKSASMAEDRDAVGKFVGENMARENTVITVSSSPEIQMENAPLEQVERFLSNYQNTDENTDLISVLELAENYNGKIVVASDLDHTGSESVREKLDEISSERNVETIDLDHLNSHGFVDMELSEDSATLLVQNFREEERTLEVDTPNGTETLNLAPLGTGEVSVELQEGQNTAKLPEDEFATDNTAYIRTPERGQIEVLHLGGESQYLEEAVNLIDFASYTSSDSFSPADVYVVAGEADPSDYGEQLEGKPVIFQQRSDFESFLPVENHSGSYEAQVETSFEIASSFSSNVESFDVTGESLASPEEAIVRQDDVVFVNVVDEKFGKQLNYPLFWRSMLKDLAGRPSMEELNVKTGDILEDAGEVKRVQKDGFHGNYAANLLDSRESRPSIDSGFSSELEEKSEIRKTSSMKYWLLILAFMASLELLYLKRRGEV